MPDRDTSQPNQASAEKRIDPREAASDQDASDELSIEELEHAAGGTDAPPPDPNAGC